MSPRLTTQKGAASLFPVLFVIVLIMGFVFLVDKGVITLPKINLLSVLQMPSSSGTTSTPSTLTVRTHAFAGGIDDQNKVSPCDDSNYERRGMECAGNKTPQYVIRGSFAGAYGAVTTWFEYWNDTTSTTYTTAPTKWSVASGEVQGEMLLADFLTTYHYRLVVEDSRGIVRGPISNATVTEPRV